MDDVKFISHTELARLLFIEPRSLLCRLYRNPGSLPKRLHLPGRRVLFEHAEVRRWLENRRQKP